MNLTVLAIIVWSLGLTGFLVWGCCRGVRKIHLCWGTIRISRPVWFQYELKLRELILWLRGHPGEDIHCAEAQELLRVAVGLLVLYTNDHKDKPAETELECFVDLIDDPQDAAFA